MRIHRLLFTLFLIFEFLNLKLLNASIFREVPIESIENMEINNFTDIKKNTPNIILANMFENFSFVEEVRKILEGINETHELPFPVRLYVLQNPKGEPLFKGDEYLKIIEKTSYDAWLQDFAKIIYFKEKGKKIFQYGVLDLNRKAYLQGFARELAKFLDLPYVLLPVDGLNAGNFGGNIQTTPNEILYLGNTAQDKLIEILKDKGYKDSIVILDTDWLEVGHVDEFIRIISLPEEKKDSCGLAILRASPILAQDILKDSFPYQSEDFLSLDPLLFPGTEKIGKEIKRYKETLMAFQNHLIGYKLFSKPDFSEAYSLYMTQKIIDDKIIFNTEKIKERIIKKSPFCQNIKIIEIPNLYKCKFFTQASGKIKSCHSFLPSSINLLSLDKHILMLDPLFPPFREYIRDTLIKNGLKPHFVKDMFYHSYGGGLHCGVNCIIKGPDEDA